MLCGIWIHAGFHSHLYTSTPLACSTCAPEYAAQQHTGVLCACLCRLLQTNSSVGPALVPHYKHLLPAMVLLLRHGEGGTAGMSKRLLLPPPYCLPPVGSFTGGLTAKCTGRASSLHVTCKADLAEAVVQYRAIQLWQ